MKTLTGLGDRLQHYEDVPEGGESFIPTYRQMVLKQLAVAASKDDENAIWHFQIGMKIRSATAEEMATGVNVEDADFKALSDACKKNAAQYIAHYQGQLILRVRDWEKAERK